MDNNIQATFKPLFFWCFIFLIFGCLFIILPMIFAFFIVYSGVWLPMKILTLIIMVMSAGLGIYSIAYPFTAKIEIYEKAIVFCQPLYTVTCEWTNIQGVASTDMVLLLYLNQHFVLKRTILGRIPLGKTSSIPLHLFVSDWNQKKAWSKNRLLIELQKYIPSVMDAVNR